MENQVAERTNGALTVPKITESWGTENTDSKDTLIPKLLLMQGLSKAVADEKAAMGDIINSTTDEVVGTGRGDGKPIEIIPFYSFKQWVVYEKLGKDKGGKEKLQFKEIVDYGPENLDWEWDDAQFRRDLTLSFYVMRVDQLESKGALPSIISFRRTSYRIGQKLSSYFDECKRENIPPAANTFMLGAVKKENDDGTWYVFDVQPHAKATEEGVKTAYYWYQQVRAGGQKVDNREYADVDTPTDKAKPAVDEETVGF